MINYIIEGEGVKQVLDNSAEVLDLIAKFKTKHPDLDYEISLNTPDADNMNWTIKLDVDNGKFDNKVFTKRA